MSGPQYIHVEGYARKATGTKTTTASGVIGEAVRQDGFCSHVESPTPPKFVHGSEQGLISLNEEIHAQAEAAKDSLGRKMRSDQTILVAGVASFPKPTKGLTEADKIELEEWIKTTNQFLYKEFKTNFKAALLHLDEEYPHIHFYVADTKNVMKTKDLHPARATGAGKNKKEGVAALKSFQDRYHEQVAQKFGMTRVGPKRERLSRPDWIEKKRQAAELAEQIKKVAIAEQKAQVAEQKAEIAISEAEAMKALAQVERAQLKEERLELQKKLTTLTNAAEKYNKEADKLSARGIKSQKSIELQAIDKMLKKVNEGETPSNTPQTDFVGEKQKPKQPRLY